ncbi:MAG: hypothetical protein WC307_03925 [Candidatus Nanoarchaeia archaeon]|jgi:hypothetical protein
MTTILSDGFAMIDQMLAPIVPAGITGIQFISVFLIVYAITYLLLSKIHFLKENRAAQLMIALVIAYFTASSAMSVILITKLFPNLGMVTIVILSFLAVIALLMPKQEDKIPYAPLIIIIAIGMIIWLTWTSVSGTLNIEGMNLPELSRSEWFGVIFLLIFVGVILLVYLTGKKGDTKSGFEKFIDAFKKLK